MGQHEGESARIFLSAPWFSEIDPALGRAVLSALTETRAASGTILLAEGHANDHLSFLMSGSAAVQRGKMGGGWETLATLAAPTLFGVTSFFRPQPPTFTVRAATDVSLLTLDHPAHDRLRRENPAAAEALAIALLRVLGDRFEELDRVFSDYMARHPDDHAKVTEWAGFRARLFDERGD